MRVIELIRRLREEFTTMPGLSLTTTQVERLCGTDAATSASALHALVSAGFLQPMPGGRFGRADVVAGGPAARGGRTPVHPPEPPVVA